ncbi:MAG: hypothetical protein AAFQ12_12440, partial [Pseudomonadota bacterium]
IRFSPMKQMLGHDSLYRLEFIESRYARRFSTTDLTRATSYGRRVSEDGKIEMFDQELGLDVYGALVNYGGEQELDRVLSEEDADSESPSWFSAGMVTSKQSGGSAPFGSAVYFPMADNLSYRVRITQNALVVEPMDGTTRRQMVEGSE